MSAPQDLLDPRTTAAAPAPGLTGNVAETLVSTLVAQGVERVFLNPGTDTAPVQEAIAALRSAGRAVPRVVLCRHEAVALAAAHAAFAVSGRPQVVMVHVDVGTQNLGAMLHNAARAEAGVVVIAGLTPRTSSGQVPGGRDTVVHWQQDVPDQAGIVRGYVKWSTDLHAAATVPEQLARAFQAAAATPPGPVYVTVAREVLMESAPATPPPAPRRALPAPMAPDPVQLARAATLLAAAERPVVVTSRLGRDVAAVAELARVAELLGAPVLDRRERVNLPSDHPCYVTGPGRTAELLEGADVVLVVDCDVPWVPSRSAPPAEATVIQLDADPLKLSMPGWDFPVDLSLQADPRLGLRALAGELTALAASGALTPRPLPRVVPAAPAPVDDPLTVAAVVRALDEVLDPADLLLDEAVTNIEVVRTGLSRTLPGTAFQCGGSGLGWALPGAIGAGLAAPGRRVVAVVGDGTFLFSQPVATLLTARDAGTPFLAVVLANGGYAASRRPVFDLFPDGASARTGEVVGTLFPEPPDAALLAAACHAWGEDVSAAAELGPALQRALGALAEGRCALLVAHVDSPWITRHPASPSPEPDRTPIPSRGDRS
ncbi:MULTISPECIES: thiamine pyrophosphate-requiring protein [unclassified Modestobacter]